MSNWTHVAGIVRIDSFRIDESTPPDFSKIFGKELKINAPEEAWQEAYEHPERFLPLGSEGSLTMTAWINPDISYIDAYTISIFGDLRDHNEPKEIIRWFREKCEKLYIRNAAITVRNDVKGSEGWYYKPKR